TEPAAIVGRAEAPPGVAAAGHALPSHQTRPGDAHAAPGVDDLTEVGALPDRFGAGRTEATHLLVGAHLLEELARRERRRVVVGQRQHLAVAPRVPGEPLAPCVGLPGEDD